MASQNATIRVVFGTDFSAGDHLSAELDSRTDGLNNGLTSFNPGDTAYILVYKTPNVTITEATVSAGSIADAGTAVVELEEDVFFEDSNTASLNKPADTISSVTFYGRNLGNVTLLDPLTIKADDKGVAVAKVKYVTTAQVAALTSPPTLDGETNFSILVLIKGAVV